MTRKSRSSNAKNSNDQNFVIRKLSALFVVLSLTLPISIPVPAYAAASLPEQVPALGLVSQESNEIGFPLNGSSVANFASVIMGNSFGFLSPSTSGNGINKNSNNVAELEKRVVAIETELAPDNTASVGNIISLAAVPVDKNGETVNGIGTKWHCTNPKIVRILNGSEAVAVGKGEAKLVVSSGNTIKEINVAVSSDNIESKAATFDDPLEQPVFTEAQAESLISAENNLGSPIGQSEMAGASRSSAIRTRERYGSSNYSFGVPVASLPGRGIDASIGLTYNSRVWNKSQIFGTTIFDYNSNGNWLSPGFEMSLGEITTFGTSTGNGIGYMLTSPDGTRHQLTQKQTVGNCTLYESNDGTFIQSTICGLYTTSPVNVVYPGGTRVLYSSTTSANKRFPIEITDRNGNMLTIAYLQNDASGRIAYIRDTLNRYINFHYDESSPKKLVAVSVPGFDGNSTPRQTIRFYYEALTLQTSGRFESSAAVNAPSSVNVLKYVYFPGTQSGYRYDYSPYFGTIYKISQRRGMTVSTTADDATGWVTDEGTEAAWTHYNYPATAMELGSPLTDVPKYSWRKDDWLGREGDIPQTNFFNERSVTPSGCEATNSCVGTNTVTVTAPDGTKSISVMKVNNGQWDDGVLTEARVATIESQQERVWSKTKLFWEQGANQPPGRANPRLLKVETTNDANQTRATSFEYDTYNNQTKITEHDFDDPGELGTELRRTEITYETGAGWIDNRLLRLPIEIKQVVGSTVVSRSVLKYDDYIGTPLANTPGVVQHASTHNPHASTHECNCRWECDGVGYGTDFLVPPSCPGGGPPPTWVCDTCSDYDPSTAFRGNVTKVISFPVTTAPENDSDNAVSTFGYDMTGNLISISGGCCELRSTEFALSSFYAYPVSETRSGQGLSMTTSATWDPNTGLMLTATDENSQTTEVTYDPATLRAERTDAPNGAWVETEYNDTIFPYHVKQTASLDATRSVSSWSFSNGRGQGFRQRSQTSGGYISSDVEFDIMGRVVRSYNPYSVSGLTDARPTGIKFTEVTSRDGLGRTLVTTLADLTTVSASYNGLVVTATDQAGKSRRQIADALGRTIRVDEPDVNGDLGSVGSPEQPTFYEYDGNDNLKKVTQSDGTNTQERLFKYDSLSRLTHEKQVEANATLNDAGVHVGGSGTWTGVYKYDTDSLLIEGIDARGVKTSFDYDGLHRITTVTYTGETGYQTPTVTYTYDQTESGFFNNNRLTKVETALNTTYGTPATVQHYRYDEMGQVVKHTQSIGSESYLQEYGYNLAGQLTAQKYPSGRIVETVIDNFGRMAGVEDGDREYVTGVTYNAQGILSQLNLGNGTHETFAYNDRFQMTSQSLMKGSEVLQKYDYSYGQTDVATGTVDATKNNGQLGKIESFIGANKQASQRFAYDSIGRLQEAREHRGDNDSLTYKQVFDFDRFGNTYRKAENNPTTGQANPLFYTPIEDGNISKTTNRFTSDTTYNDAGQVVADSKFREMGFGYDANGRQVKATKTSQPDAWTVYDALGNRVGTKINDVWQLMVYDAFGKLVAEYGVAAGTLGGVKYVQQDWQGSVRTGSNANGFVVARTDHQAFGEDIGVGVGLRKVEQGYSADKATRQGYGLTENDESSGLSHTWFRKLENQAGRWTSPDPYNGSMNLSNPQSFNRYSYVENQPTNFVDPSGLCGYTITWIGWSDGTITYTTVWTSSCNVGGSGSGNGVSGGGGLFGDSVFQIETGPEGNEGPDSGGGGAAGTQGPHQRGGPYHSPASTRCHPSDSCSQLLGKMHELERMVKSHVGWDNHNAWPRGNGRHAQEITDLYNGHVRCMRMYQMKCKNNSPSVGARAPSRVPARNSRSANDGNSTRTAAGIGAGVGAGVLAYVLIKKGIGILLLPTPAAPVGGFLLVTP